MHSYSRGHKIIWNSEKEIWIYADTGKEYNKERSCKRCGKQPTAEGHDACLGKLKKVVNACCGHGVKGESYVHRN